MHVRPADADDFDAVTALLEELGRPRVSADTAAAARAVYDAQIDDPAAEHLVAEDDDGAVVGFCSLHFRERLNHASEQAWIPDLVVAPGARRRGVGRALLAEAERRARERGCHDLTLESSHHRSEAHALYEAVGMAAPGLFFGKRL